MSNLRLRDHFEIFGPLIPARDVEQDLSSESALDYNDDELRSLRIVARYIRDFLAKPQAGLGRAGPVCPFVSRALRRSLLLVAACHVGSVQRDEIAEALENLRENLCNRKKCVEAEDVDFISAIIVFPYLSSENDFAFIEDIQRILKPKFVESGMMIGEFYPGCPTRGLHSDQFRPLSAPLPFIAIRSMTLQDAPFMLGDGGYQAAYQRVFGKPGRERLEALGASQGMEINATSLSAGPLHGR